MSALRSTRRLVGLSTRVVSASVNYIRGDCGKCLTRRADFADYCRFAKIASSSPGGDGSRIKTRPSKPHYANVAAEAPRTDSSAGLHRSEVLGDVQGRLSGGRCSTESIARRYSSLPDTGFRRRTRPQAESINTDLGRAVPVGLPDRGRRAPDTSRPTDPHVG